MAQTILFMKFLVLSLAALPLFYLSREMTRSERTSLMIGISYLLHYSIQEANWFDFQPQIFMLLVSFTMFLAFVREE